jgi:hypothetical protein
MFVLPFGPLIWSTVPSSRVEMVTEEGSGIGIKPTCEPFLELVVNARNRDRCMVYVEMRIGRLGY